MKQPDSPEQLKVVRVVTAGFVVSWHMHNTLTRMADDFDVTVIGENVSYLAGNYPKVRFVNINIQRKNSLGADFGALIGLVSSLRTLKPDVVHSIMPKAGLLAAVASFICRVPVRMHTFTGQTWVGRKGFARLIYWLVDWLVNTLNTRCMTDSPSQSRFLAQHGIHAKGLPLAVLSHGSLCGVDLNRFDAAKYRLAAEELKNRLGLDPSHFVYAYIARKTRDKGAWDMLEAFAIVSQKHKHARLLFVGPDEDGDIVLLRQLRPEWFGAVLDIGPVDNHEVYLAASDVMCMPSYREGFGSVVIEAAAMGRPTIGSHIPGLIDSVVDGRTGLLFDAGNVLAFSQGMLRLQSEPLLRKSLGAQAKQRAEVYFSADVLYGALKSFYATEFDRMKR